jgi:hypothetical protein
MKIILKAVLCISIILSFGVNAFASNTTMNYEELSANYKQLQLEYDLAVKNEDLEQQKLLINQGNTVVDQMMEIDEKQLRKMSTRSIKSNPFGTTYYDYFSKSVWINRNGVYSLSIYPINLAWPSSQIDTAWNFIVDKHSSDSRWDNEKVLRKQFWCHANFAGSMKTPWNIEPSKTSINPFTCN